MAFQIKAMTQEELKNYAIEKASLFGFIQKKDEASKGNAVFRCNLEDVKGANYFGFIRPEEPYTGAYSDFSLVVFARDDTSFFFVSLGVGSQGFSNDYELASLPGVRRMFLKLLDNNGDSFCKPSFTDTENQSLDFADYVSEKHQEFKPIVDKYGQCLPVIRCLNSEKADDLKALDAWLATYAILRQWATNNGHRRQIENTLKAYSPANQVDGFEAIKSLLDERKYIVLQGAPGTGKTFTANRIASTLFKAENVLFEQFHAETTYSDFVFGIEPNLEEPGKFKKKEGILYRAIKLALSTKEDVLLIIDEINRANLANVLGPVFYLFENGVNDRMSQMKVGDQILSTLPTNLYVIATMNTADRSLAVVDFALRRRFAWYTLRPRALTHDDLKPGQGFDTKLYNNIASIFERYATDEELNLQPGQSYFVTDGGETVSRNKIVFELMPLIKEYLREGYLSKAKESFSNLFYERVQLQLFE